MIRWEIPIKTVSESNCSEHWSVKRKRHRRQQFFVRCAFVNQGGMIPLPCTITLTRISQKLLDDDNLQMAFKFIRDELAACFFPEKVVVYQKSNGKLATNKGNADSDPRITWKYGQEKGKRQGIRIEIDSI